MTPRLRRTSSEIDIARDRAELRLIHSHIVRLLDEKSEGASSVHEKSGSEKSGDEESSRGKSSRDSSARRCETKDSTILDARSGDSTSDEFDSFDDHVSATPVRDAGREASPGGLPVPDDESPSTAPIRKLRRTRSQKKQLAAVVLSFPLRATVCALNLPFIALDQIATSIGRAVRKDKSASVARWPKVDTLPANVYKKYGRCMILYSQTDDANNVIFDQVHVTGRNRKVRIEDITGFNTSPTFRNLGLDGRLDIMAHGDAQEVGDFDPVELASWLEIKKLKRVGVLNVDSCAVGAGTFLEELGNEMHRRGMQFGWIAGSREKTSDFRVPANLGDRHYSFSTFPYPWKRDAGVSKPASLNRKILEGNVAVRFPGTVFDRKKPAWRVASSYSPLR